MLPLHRLTTLITGKITLTDPEGQSAEYIYQRCKPGLGNLHLNERNDRQLLRYRRASNLPTHRRTLVRERFQEGTTAWNALTPTEHADWERRAQPLALTGYNLFHREWAKAHPLDYLHYSRLKATVLEDGGLATRRETLISLALHANSTGGRHGG